MVKNADSIGEVRKKITKTHEMISTSYHEAGHTVYALCNFMEVYSVSIFEDKKLKRINGVTCYYHPTDLDSIKNPVFLIALAEAEIGVGYAGLIAEKAFFKFISGSDRAPRFVTEGADKDYKEADEIIRKYKLAPPGKKRGDLKKKISKEVQSVIYNNWDAVTVIAHSLFRHRKLSYKRLQMLLTTKTRNKKFWKEHFKKLNKL